MDSFLKILPYLLYLLLIISNLFVWIIKDQRIKQLKEQLGFYKEFDIEQWTKLKIETVKMKYRILFKDLEKQVNDYRSWSLKEFEKEKIMIAKSEKDLEDVKAKLEEYKNTISEAEKLNDIPKNDAQPQQRPHPPGANHERSKHEVELIRN